ncbi:hypothetical protein Bpfe_003578 [Biomphalaria pfeifferi]|uniref:Uncharacterized protein n=1 Tax=Biomphalaria pfeifferi TaxID=112525 RepID=A0AAD8FK35_BIOPF|nr:hypothetical protein Bpfe_003578 [Biomphalaria pfeifferi]
MSACHIGSGRIADIYPNRNEMKTCLCSDCLSDNVKKETWIIEVLTATHVVFDDSEAKKSKCTLFYDSYEGRSTKSNGSKCRHANTFKDLSLLECIACDRELANVIMENIRSLNVLCATILERYTLDKGKNKNERNYHNNRLVVLGCHTLTVGQKKISIGRLERIIKRRKKCQKGCLLLYDTSTCVGSGGAPVYLYGQDWLLEEYVHSGRTSDKKLKVDCL